MKRLFFCLVVAIVAGSVVTWCLHVPEMCCVAQEITSTSDQTFDRDVTRATLPVLVDFYATWCGPCRRMAPIVDDFARRHGNQLRVFRCDVDQNRSLAARYEVSAIPTFIVFHHGTPVGRVTGATSKESFESTIQRFLK
jgi:thioredoxin 1